VINQNATSTKNAAIRKKEQRERFVPERMISFFHSQFLIKLPRSWELNRAQKEKEMKRNKENSYNS